MVPGGLLHPISLFLESEVAGRAVIYDGHTSSAAGEVEKGHGKVERHEEKQRNSAAKKGDFSSVNFGKYHMICVPQCQHPQNSFD